MEKRNIVKVVFWTPVCTGGSVFLNIFSLATPVRTGGSLNRDHSLAFMDIKVSGAVHVPPICAFAQRRPFE